MVTKLKLGPADHGRPLTYDEFMTADYAGGAKYELIHGRLYVSPAADFPHLSVNRWIYRKLDRYAEDHPEVINFVSYGSRVFVPDQDDLTNPEPDVAAYRDFPVDAPPNEVNWRDQSPILTVEVISPDDPGKDLERNRDLYLLVPSIREYWVLNRPERGGFQPTLRVHKRHGRTWRVRDLAGGAVYTTRLLPGFELTLDIRR